ncbi:MAG: hypothetical protein GXO86_08845 [Chlorobi bacterium]|nr:hypothetical protein [Chlorobiota bacterium]
MSNSKPRVIKDFDKLDEKIQEQIKLAYPSGFSEHLITFTNKDGLKVSALPFETDDKYYLVRMTVQEAYDIIDQDDDYDDSGFLRDEIKAGYEDKYTDLDLLDDADLLKGAEEDEDKPI